MAQSNAKSAEHFYLPQEFPATDEWRGVHQQVSDRSRTTLSEAGHQTHQCTVQTPSLRGKADMRLTV